MSNEQFDKKEKFERIAVPYFNIIYNSAYRMTGNRNDAEDLVQDVFLSAYRSFHQFIEGTNCKAWLFKILKNTFINRIRKANREKVINFDFQTPQIQDIDDGLAKIVQKALNKLPEEFRMAVILCDIEGFSYQEIAEVLECPVGTVRSRINRARRFLSEELKDLRA
jgi:RNA polymerase sigma-70 factor (ECF subfamily)